MLAGRGSLSGVFTTAARHLAAQEPMPQVLGEHCRSAKDGLAQTRRSRDVLASSRYLKLKCPLVVAPLPCVPIHSCNGLWTTDVENCILTQLPQCQHIHPEIKTTSLKSQTSGSGIITNQHTHWSLALAAPQCPSLLIQKRGQFQLQFSFSHPVTCGSIMRQMSSKYLRFPVSSSSYRIFLSQYHCCLS